MSTQSQAEETEELSKLLHADRLAIKQEIDREFATLHNRAQVLLGICGVVLTASVLITTGRILGRGQYSLARLAGWLLALAGMCDIVSTSIVVGGVMQIRWLTQHPDEDLRGWMTRAIEYRDRKTRMYHLALAVLLLSMMFYQAAVLIVALQL